MFIADTAEADVVSKDTAPTPSLTALAETRKQWQTGAYRTSNQQLYALLAQCYGYYQCMREDNVEARSLRKQLADFINEHGIRVTPSTHGIPRILKCVFFDGVNTPDRRRISTYSIVLRSAHSMQLRADAVAEFIESNGGVQEVRLSKSRNAKTAKQKAALGRSALDSSAVLVSVRAEALSQQFDVSDFDQPVALLGILRASGEVEVRAVVRKQSALTAALAANYSIDKAGTSKAA